GGAAEIVLPCRGAEGGNRLGGGGVGRRDGFGRNMGGKLANGGEEVDVAHRNAGAAGRLAQPGGELRHQQRVGAEGVEEVILNRHPLDLQQARKGGSDDLLGGIGGRHIGGRGAGVTRL